MSNLKVQINYNIEFQKYLELKGQCPIKYEFKYKGQVFDWKHHLGLSSDLFFLRNLIASTKLDFHAYHSKLQLS